jgi:hypothetical protein
LLKPHVTKLLVCDPRKNASMREGNQSDKIDARRSAEPLRLNHPSPVYHGEQFPATIAVSTFPPPAANAALGFSTPEACAALVR